MNFNNHKSLNDLRIFNELTKYCVKNTIVKEKLIKRLFQCLNYSLILEKNLVLFLSIS